MKTPGIQDKMSSTSTTPTTTISRSSSFTMDDAKNAIRSALTTLPRTPTVADLSRVYSDVYNVTTKYHAETNSSYEQLVEYCNNLIKEFGGDDEKRSRTVKNLLRPFLKNAGN